MERERDVLESRKRFHQLELLVDHADPGGHRGQGRAGTQGPAVHEDPAAIMEIEAREDVHRRGLSGAVLADQTKHPAGRNVEADLVVGENRAEALGHPLQANQRPTRGWRVGRGLSQGVGHGSIPTVSGP